MNLTQSAISSIRSYYPNLSKLHQKIADYIFAQLKWWVNSRLTSWLRELVFPPPQSTVAKAVGYSNFREFSLDLANVSSDVNRSNMFKKVKPDDTPKEMAQRLFKRWSMRWSQRSHLLHNDELEEISNYILKCNQLCFLPDWGSSVAALDGYHKFLRTSINSEYYPDFDVQLMQAAKMDTRNDCAIMISPFWRKPANWPF